MHPGVVIDFSPGHITPQSTQLRCEVLRMTGPLQGELNIKSTTEDGFLRTTGILNITFESPPADESMSATTLVGGGIGALVFIAGLLFVLRGRANDEEFTESTEMRQQGPPVSESTNEKAVPSVETAVPLQAGPPASSGPTRINSPINNIRSTFTRERATPGMDTRAVGYTTVNNTLMEPFDYRFPWTPTLLHGTPCGLLSQFVAWEHGTCATLHNGYKHRYTPFWARHRC